MQQVDERKSEVTGNQVSRQMLLNNNFCAVTSNTVSITAPYADHIPSSVTLVSTPCSYNSIVGSSATGINCSTSTQCDVGTDPATNHYGGMHATTTTVTPARSSSPHTSFIPLDILPVVPERASVDSLSLALLSQQIPPLPKFSSEDQDGDGETFEDWKEQLELIAHACQWNN